MNYLNYVLMLGLTLAYTNPANAACRRDLSGHGTLLCPGDSVVSPTNITGQVIGVNAYEQRVSVDLDFYSNNASYSIRDVFAGFGCMHSVCVGDRVVSPTNITGTVIGLNPYSRQVSVDLDFYSNNASYDLDSIFLTSGCVQGVCVNDHVVTPNNIEGIVIGVNRYHRTVSVDLEYYSNNQSYHVEDIFVTNECLDYGPDYRSRNSGRQWPVPVNFDFSLTRK